MLFPEGTSSDGDTVLPFKSALLAPATQQEHLLSASFIRYALDDGSVADEVCYWRDMTLVPHLLNLLGKRGGLRSRLVHAGSGRLRESQRTRPATPRGSRAPEGSLLYLNPPMKIIVTCGPSYEPIDRRAPHDQHVSPVKLG